MKPLYYGSINKSREGDPFGDGWLVHIFKRKWLFLRTDVAGIWCETEEEAEFELNDKLRRLESK